MFSAPAWLQGVHRPLTPCASRPLSPPPQLPYKGFGNEGREGVAVLLPAGTYRVTRMVEIYQSNVVLRGEGVRGDMGGGSRGARG